jgi:hypothetical protein
VLDGNPSTVAGLKSIVVGEVTWWLLVFNMIGSSATATATAHPSTSNKNNKNRFILCVASNVG